MNALDEGRHIALYAPNIVNVCIDRYDNGEASGRIYHCYDEKPWYFENVIRMVGLIESLFDSINFPQASTKTRSFVRVDRQTQLMSQRVVESSDVAKQRGTLQSFLVHVRYRQNASWQGDTEWLEGGSIQEFKSVLELLKVFNNVLEQKILEK